MKRIIPVILLVVLAVYLVVYGHGVPPTPHNAVRIKDIPVQDTAGNVLDNYLMKYNLSTGVLEWEADATGGGGGGDTSLFLSEAFGTGTRTVFLSNDSLFFKFGSDTILIVSQLSTQTVFNAYDNTTGFLYNSNIDMNNNDINLSQGDVLNPTNINNAVGNITITTAGGASDLLINDNSALRWTFTDNRFTGEANATIVLDTIAVASGTGIVSKSPFRLFVDDADSNVITSLDVDTRITDSVGNYLPLTGGTLTGRLFIDGGADQAQLIVQGFPAQDSDLVIIEKSDGTDVFNIDADGEVTITQTVDHINAQGLTITEDAAGFGGIAGLAIDFTTGAMGAGDDNHAIFVNINQTASTGGVFHALKVLSTSTGGVASFVVEAGVGVGALVQHSGVLGSLTFAEKRGSGGYTDWVAEGNSTSSDITLWDAVNDTVFLGFATKFEELSWDWEAIATKNMRFTFAFSITGPSWTVFTPVDGTNGATTVGNISWDEDNLPSWSSASVDGDAAFWIAIIRTGVPGTSPTENLVQIAAPTDHEWDNLGNITAHSIQIDSMASFSGSRILLTDPIYLGDSTEADSAYITEGGVSSVYETIVNVAKIGDDTTNFLLAFDSTQAWDNRGYAQATVSALGIASFATADFAVASGAVTIKAAGVDLTSQVTGELPDGNIPDHTGDVTGGTALIITKSVLEDAGARELVITAGMMNTGTGATASTFWRGDNVWAVPAGGSAVWAQSNDSSTLVDVSDNDTTAVFKDDDNDTVSWDIGADQAYLKIAVDADGVTVGPPGLTTIDSADVILLKFDDFILYTGGDNGGAYDSTDVPTNGQALTWLTGGIIGWVTPSGGSGTDSSLYVDSIMVEGNTETGITVTFNTVDTTMDYVVGSLDSTFLNANSIGESELDLGTGAQQISIIDIPAVNWSVFSSNGGGVIGEITVGAANTFFGGNGVTSAPTWQNIDLASADVTGTLPVGNGGTGAATYVLGELLLGNTTSPLTGTGVLGTNVLIIGDNSGAPSFNAMSGDGTLVSGGTFTIADDVVDTTNLQTINLANDEEIMTFEATGPGFEFHSTSELDLMLMTDFADSADNHMDSAEVVQIVRDSGFTSIDTGTFAMAISNPNSFVQDTIEILKVDASKYADSLIFTELALETRQATTDSAWLEIWTNLDHTAGTETVLDTLGKTSSRIVEPSAFNVRGPAQGEYLMLIVRLASASATEWHVRGTFWEK